jgi:hypothetical protein
MQSRDNHLDRSTAPGFRVLAQPSRSPTPLQQSRPDTVLPPIFLSRCVTKSTHVPFARRSLDGLDHSIPIERLAEGLLQIAVSRTPRPEHSLSPSKFTAPGRSRYSAKDFATGIAWADSAWLGRQWSSRIETGVWHRELSMYFLPMERGKSKVKARRATSMPVSGKQSQPH